MATINIANLTFTHKGNYDGSTSYVKNDVVYYATNGNAYIAKQGTTGNVPTNGTYWSQFAAGSGGIWNAGLSLGSAGQSVKVNAAGNALEFGTISSDYVKLASVDSTSGEVSFDGFFTSDYKVYDVIAHMCISNGTNWAKIFVNSGGSKVTASNYRIVASGASRDSGADATIKYSKWNEAYGIAHYWGGPAKFSCRIFNPLDTTTEKFIHIEANSYQSDTKLWRENIVNVYHSDAAISGVTFGSSGTLGIFQADLYGIKT